MKVRIVIWIRMIPDEYFEMKPTKQDVHSTDNALFKPVKKVYSL